MLSFGLLLAWSGIFCASLTPCRSTEYYITPTSQNCTPGELCLTLDDYANNSSRSFHHAENATLFLLKGTHVLYHTLTICNVQQFLLTGFDEHGISSRDDFLVQMFVGGSLVFENISLLVIENIQLLGNYPVTLVVHKAALNRVTLIGCELDLLGGTTSVSYSTITNCTYIIICMPPIKNISGSQLYIHRSLITDSPIRQCYTWSYYHLNLYISACIIQYIHIVDQAPISLSIDSGANVYTEITNTFCIGCIYIDIEGRDNNVTTVIHRSNLTRFGVSYAAININARSKCRSTNIDVLITESNIRECHRVGLLVGLYLTFNLRVGIVLKHCNLTGNKDGALVVPVHRDDLIERFYHEDIHRRETELNIDIKECIFDRNGLAIGTEIRTHFRTNQNFAIHASVINSTLSRNKGALVFSRNFDLGLNLASELSISLKNVTVGNNSSPSLAESAVQVVAANLTIDDCRIENNSDTALKAYFSDVTLAGTVVFSGNRGVKGGALAMYQSLLYLNEFCNITFIGNSARDRGGAIYIEQFSHIVTSWDLIYPRCFGDLKTNNSDAYYSFIENVHERIKVKMIDNFAAEGGDDIYGGSLNGPCTLGDHGLVEFASTYKVVQFDNYTTSSVTSDPKRVCLCNDKGKPECANLEYIFAKQQPRYPGEMFSVSATLVGYDFGTVPGIVYSNVLHEDENITLGHNQRLQEIKDHRKCTMLNFSILSPITNSTYTIRLNGTRDFTEEERTDPDLLDLDINFYKHFNSIQNSLLYQRVYISVPLVDCPTGFKLSTTTPHTCSCHPNLTRYGINKCVISNHTGWVYRSGTVWISASSNDTNETDGIVLHGYSPYDYCKSQNISVNLRDPDRQCMFHRSGVLCGGCHGNLSMVLGTSKCLHCDNRYVPLIIVFALAGFILVFFIKVLDLTVAKGTTSGLILYANIVWANKSILFPATESVHPALHILHTFIAWMNLDLGIETCFIAGLNAYWKTWLQFVFPVYIWTITGVMIVVAHYSTRASKIFGNNSVPVLATLILLSYTKLLRTIITSLGFSLLDYPEGIRVVWSFDGNVPYFGAAHTILLLVAVAALLLLWLPYTTVLLILQWLRRKSYLKPLRWINRWKPFFDAYFGQLKPKFHYWVGLLLVVRVVLLVLFAAVSATAPKVNILAIDIVGVTLLAYTTVTGSVYKTWHLSLLENSFIINLTVLAGGTLFMQAMGKPNTPVVYTSVGIAFFKFLVIVIHQTGRRIRSSYMTYKRQHTNTDNQNNAIDTEMRVMTCALMNYNIYYREPLLEISGQ